MNGISPIQLSIILFIGLIYVIPTWAIMKKAGINKWLSLIALIPLGNILVLYFIAFIKWPDKK